MRHIASKVIHVHSIVNSKTMMIVTNTIGDKTQVRYEYELAKSPYLQALVYSTPCPKTLFD